MAADIEQLDLKHVLSTEFMMSYSLLLSPSSTSFKHMALRKLLYKVCVTNALSLQIIHGFSVWLLVYPQRYTNQVSEFMSLQD